jgi:hypothetical protein
MGFLTELTWAQLSKSQKANKVFLNYENGPEIANLLSALAPLLDMQ